MPIANVSNQATASVAQSKPVPLTISAPNAPGRAAKSPRAASRRTDRGFQQQKVTRPNAARKFSLAAGGCKSYVIQFLPLRALADSGQGRRHQECEYRG